MKRTKIFAVAVLLLTFCTAAAEAHNSKAWQDRIDAQRPVAAGVRPLEVQVVALDWKWLFLYPEQGIATVNELAAPVDRPIHFKLTASSTMNAFYVPDLAGMIYSMPGMQTELNAPEPSMSMKPVRPNRSALPRCQTWL